jgi:hypothetical protein
MCGRAPGVDNPLWDSFMVEVEYFFSEYEIFEPDRTPPHFELVLIVGDPNPLVCRQVRLGGICAVDRNMLMCFSPLAHALIEIGVACHREPACALRGRETRAAKDGCGRAAHQSHCPPHGDSLAF